ncbi:hypothetical protein JCM17823_11490 [Halorubrum gandharaense]
MSDDPSGRAASPGWLRSAARRGARSLRGVTRIVGRGPSHFQRVHAADHRVVVSGARGKSTLVRWLHDALVDDGVDTFAKITGDHPAILRNEEETPIERGHVTRLYENERLYAEHGPATAIVAENQGIREYTTRLANELWDPQVVVLLNVRRDHLGTLGDDLADLVRAFARTVPDDCHVVCGDRNPAIADYLENRLAERGVGFTHVDPPDEYDVLGARTAFAVDTVLSAVGAEPAGRDYALERLSELRTAWTWRRLSDGGLVCNAAGLNDVESTEHLRRHLVEALDEPTVEPVCYLRRERAGRTASFIRYAEWLHGNGLVERVHVTGTHTDLFKRRADVPVVVHEDKPERASEVLDAALAYGNPVVYMANTVAEFMRQTEEVLDDRTVDRVVADDWDLTGTVDEGD